jgi:hypothetical protein
VFHVSPKMINFVKSINQLVFVMGMNCVLCVVEIEFCVWYREMLASRCYTDILYCIVS